MEMILHLQNLSKLATSLDIRHFFGGLDIPVGGVQIVGGEDGDAFINFCTEQDLLQALNFGNKPLLGQRVKLFLAKEDDVHRVIEKRNRELDRAKANFLGASSHAGDTEEIGHFKDHPFDKCRIHPTDQNRPSYRSYDKLASSQRYLFDEEERSQVDLYLSSNSYTEENSSRNKDAENRFRGEDSFSSTKRADLDRNYQDRSPPDDPTNLYVEAINQLLGGDSFSVKPNFEKRSGDHSRDHPSHRDKKLKLEGDKVATSRERDFKKRQEAKSYQKPAETESDIEYYDDGDDRPERHQSREKHESREGRKTGVRYKSREKESLTDKHMKQEISKSRDKGKSSKGKQASQDVSRNRDKDDKGLKAKHAEQNISRSRDRKDKNRGTDRGDKNTRSRDSATRGNAKEDKSKDKGKKTDKNVKREQQRERSRSRERNSTPNRQNTNPNKNRKETDEIATGSSRDSSQKSEREYHTEGHKTFKLDCIGLYHLDITVTATDIRKFLKLWEIPEGGIILRADKHNPNALIAYVKYYPRENVEVKSLINTFLNGRPVDVKSVPMEIFNQERLSDRKSEETPPLSPPAPATRHPTYFPPPPGVYPRPMGMPRMPMPRPWCGPPQGVMGPPSPMMRPPRTMMGPPPPMMGPFPPTRGMMPAQRMDFSQGMPPQPSPPRPPFPEDRSSMDPSHQDPLLPLDKKPLHYILFNHVVLPANCTASEVWSWFDGPDGPADHAIILTKRENVPFVAYVAFLEQSTRDEELAARKEREGLACTHYDVCQELLFLSGKMHVFQSTESGVDKDISAIINPHSSQGIMGLHYLHLNPDVLPLQCSANQVWSWFGGPRGPTLHTLLVATEKHAPPHAFVGFFEKQKRDEEMAMRVELKAEQCSDYTLTKMIFGKNVDVFQSTLSGVNKMIWSKAKANSHTTAKIPSAAPTKSRIPPATSGIPLATPRIVPPKEKGQSQPSRQLRAIMVSK